MDQERGDLPPEQIAAAERLAGLEFTDSERDLMREGLDELRQAYAGMRTIPLPNDVYPALVFDPRLPGMVFEAERHPLRLPAAEVSRPASLDELAFLPVTGLAALIRSRQINAVELTEIFLRRLERYDPAL